MQSLSLKIKGLYTHASELSEVPDGALQLADNVVIDKESVVQPRRGFERMSSGLSDTAYRANKLFFYQEKLLVHYSTNLLAYFNAGWTQYSGTNAPPVSSTQTVTFTDSAVGVTANTITSSTLGVLVGDELIFSNSGGALPTGISAATTYYAVNSASGVFQIAAALSGTALDITAAAGGGTHTVVRTRRLRIRAAQANQNFYFTTASGVKKLDAYNSSPVDAGSYKALDVQASSSASTSVWLADKYRVAFRVLWGYKDANNNLILGAPSQRESYKNVAGATKAVDLSITIPDGVTVDWLYQVYRSAAVNNTVEAIEPSDELGLVYEGNPTDVQLAAKIVTLTDITPDELRGATIYTAATQEGLAAGNETPPLAKDICVFKNVMFYANTVSKHRYYLTLLSAGASPGIATDDTVTIGGIAYTAKGTENVGAAEFKVFSSGSDSQKIRDTAISLIRVINQHTSSTVVAFYLSGPDDLPGKILIEEEILGSSAFAVISSKATCWNPALPASGTAQSSTNDAFKNAVFFSKTSQPEAVPLGNFFFAGSADSEILRIIPLRDSVFILKEDGIYRISGEDASSFRVDLFDSTTRLLAPETAVVLNNQIFALTDQGVVAITEGGVQVKSRPIEITLQELQGEGLTALRELSFAISYETERKYILCVPSITGDTSSTQQYVYNTFTNTWTRWTLTPTCGLVDPDNDLLYMGDARSNFVNSERKTLSYLDYADHGGTSTITSVNGVTLVLSSVENISVGDMIYQSATVFAAVTAVNLVTSTVTVQNTRAYTATSSVTILKAIDSRISWIPFTAGNPGMLKHFREASLLFKKDFSGDAKLVFRTDVSGSPEIEDLTGSGSGRWGNFPWGLVPWGGRKKRRPIRVAVPLNKQRCSQISCEFRHATAFTDYQLNGISLIASPGSERLNNG